METSNVILLFIIGFCGLNVLIFGIGDLIEYFKQRKAVKKFMKWTETVEYKNLIKGD